MVSFKRFVAKCLCNQFSSELVRFCCVNGVRDLRWPGYRFVVPRDVAASETASAIFFGIYEGAEIRFVEEHLPRDQDVIELGASLGIVSSHIARKLGDGSKFVAVEANNHLIPITRENISRHAAPNLGWKLLNKAYSSRETELRFSFGKDHTASCRSDDPSTPSSVVPCIALRDLIEENGIRDYTLVSDIEGSEIELFMEEEDALGGCRKMIVELHRGEYDGKQLEVEDLRRIIVEKLKFKVVQEHGPVGVYSRS